MTGVAGVKTSAELMGATTKPMMVMMMVKNENKFKDKIYFQNSRFLVTINMVKVNNNCLKKGLH